MDFFCPWLRMKWSSRSTGELHQNTLGAFVSACVCTACCFDAAVVSKYLLSPGKNIYVTVAAVALGSATTCHPQRGEADSVGC